MPTVLQFRRGTTSQNDSFTGALGELSVDTDKDQIRVHDGSTAGGFALIGAASTDTLTNKTLTSPVINTGTFGTSILPVSADGTTLGSASKEFSDLFLADGGTIQFGNDQDVVVTHDPDDGLFFKSAATGDDNPFLLTLQTGETDIAANDVLGQINFQAPDEGTGTDAILVAAGIAAISEGDFSSSSNATKLSFQTGASEAAAEKMSLSSGGNLTVSGRIITDDTTDATSTTDGSLQTDGGLSVAKDAVFGDDVSLLSDSSVLKFGADNDITLTHAADTGLTLNGTFNATVITASGRLITDDTTDATSTTDGSLQTDGGLSVAKDAVIGDDMLLLSDAAVIKFGADSDVTLTHVADAGLTLSVPATADNSFPKFNLSAGDNDIAADDVLGQIDFQAPAEGAGTDAILVGATIKAVSEGNFAADNNATTLFFETGKSAAAGTDGGRLTLTSTGKMVLKDLATADGSSATITLQSGDTDIAANDVLGGILFQAPDEGTGTDAILVAGAVECVSEGDFSSSNNATKISFRCGNSETATEKAKIVGSTGKFHATPDSILLIKNSSGSTLKTVNGHAAI
tara:strand:- start:2984 stop:4705 length:1722 start_codon:yes stop_codon:yes gene_type:complete